MKAKLEAVAELRTDSTLSQRYPVLLARVERGDEGSELASSKILRFLARNRCRKEKMLLLVSSLRGVDCAAEWYEVRLGGYSKGGYFPWQ